MNLTGCVMNLRVVLWRNEVFISCPTYFCSLLGKELRIYVTEMRVLLIQRKTILFSVVIIFWPSRPE